MKKKVGYHTKPHVGKMVTKMKTLLLKKLKEIEKIMIVNGRNIKGF
jgi:hypothetical protein